MGDWDVWPYGLNYIKLNGPVPFQMPAFPVYYRVFCAFASTWKRVRFHIRGKSHAHAGRAATKLEGLSKGACPRCGTLDIAIRMSVFNYRHAWTECKACAEPLEAIPESMITL